MHTKLKQKKAQIVSVFGTLLFVAGCSANPHTIAGAPPSIAGGGITPTGAQSVKPPAGNPFERPVVVVADEGSDGDSAEGGDGGNGGAGGAGGAGGVGVDGTDGRDGVSPPAAPAETNVVVIQEAPAPAPAPAPQPPQVIVVNGIDGRDGRDACSSLVYDKEFRARPLNAAEMATVSPILPYVSGAGHRISTRQIGQPQRNACGIGTVQNAQMLFAVDVEVPNFQAYKRLSELSLNLDLSKVVTRNETRFLSSEMICLLNGVNKCSGEAISASNWQRNMNPEFFGATSVVRTSGSRGRGSIVAENSPVLNALFSEAVRENPLEQRCGGQRIFQSEARFNLPDGFAGIDLMGLIYEGQTESTVPYTTKTLYFVVADDTYIKQGLLRVNMVYDGCKLSEMEDVASAATNSGSI